MHVIFQFRCYRCSVTEPQENSISSIVNPDELRSQPMMQAFSCRQPRCAHLQQNSAISKALVLIAHKVKNGIEIWGDNLHFPLLKAMKSANYLVTLHSISLLSYYSKLSFHCFINSVRLALKMRLKRLDGQLRMPS